MTNNACACRIHISQDDQRKSVFAKLSEAPSQPSNTAVEASPSVEGLLFLPTELKAARSRHKNSPKGFACFLSHHKQACAAEARLVKQELESILDAKVFLGKCLCDATTYVRTFN